MGRGDMAPAADAIAKIGNLDGVMVGRGTFGNPWVMADIVCALRSAKEQSPEITLSTLTFEQKIPFILEHCELAVRHKGEERGMLEMRRHLSSYVKGFDGAKEMREKLVRVEKLEQVKEILTSR